MSYASKKPKIIFIFLIIGACFSSVYANAKESEKLKLNYVKQIASQPMGYQHFTLEAAVNQAGKREWIVTGKEIYFQKQQFSSDNYDVTKYKTKIKAKLAADFTLLQYQATKRKNGTLSNSVNISFKRDKNKYIINKNSKEAERKKERTIKTEQPVYFYQPWAIEILVKNDLLPESKKARFLRKNSSDKYQINFFYLKKLSSDDNQGEKVFLVSKCKDKIFINERNGLAKMHCKENSVDIISGTINKDKIEPLEVTKFSHISSNVKFINQERLSRLKLKVNLPFEIDKNKYLNSSRQNFVGTVDENGFKGKVIIKAEKYNSKQSIPFPIEKRWAKKREQYLAATPKIEADAVGIRYQAKVITKEAATAWEAAKAIGKWVHENIEYKFNPDATAQETLEEGYGVCGQQSLLAAALCRVVDIPARCIGGFTYSSEDNVFGAHGWIEVYLGQTGWVPLDPTNGQFEFVDASHFSVLINDTSMKISNYGKQPQIKVLNYAPAEAAVVRRKIDFSAVGEFNKISYIVEKNGQQIGNYRAKLIRKDNKVLLKEELNKDKGTESHKAKLMFNQAGYVESYTKNYKFKGGKYSVAFDYGSQIKLTYKAANKPEQKSKITSITSEKIIQFDRDSYLQLGLLLASLTESLTKKDTKISTVFLINTSKFGLKSDLVNMKFELIPSEIEVKGMQVPGWICYSRERGIKVFLTEDGLMTKFKVISGDLVVKLDTVS